MTDVIELADLERLARARLTDVAWGYYASGADDELTLGRNAAAYRELVLHYRVLVDVAQRRLATTVLGQPVELPVLVAPTAFHRLAHADGELATARGAGAAGTVMILSTLSNTPVEDVVAAAAGPVWFQLYVYRDRGRTEALVRRVEAAGCQALVLTVDAPLLGQRVRDVRNRFSLPAGLDLANVDGDVVAARTGEIAESGLAAYFAALLDPSLSWRDVAWLRGVTRLPIVIKGVVRADDARRAVDAGVAAVVVSNHGGRQLDTSPATIEVLPAVAAAAADAVEVYVDGGVRRGTDVVKALARGARAVLIGRPVLWGLAVDGADGVATALAILRRELDLAMALCGCPDLAGITPDLLDGGR
ncbi:MAG: alpha-hydroxy-acid oxidizing protein [Myxococcales bacterium]|nr:alpha-hydroxy-acid oxidizing protein [Myxococcales bacterium]